MPDNATVGLQIAELALNPSTGDLALPVRILHGADAVAQRVRVRFRWFLGEWFLDRRQGVPYIESILVKNPDPILITFIFRKVLLLTPGVKSVKTFHASLDRPTRHLTVTFEAVLNDDSIMTFNKEEFIIGDQ